MDEVYDQGLTNWATGTDQEISGCKRILVVDDYESMRKVIVEALSQSGRYELSEAANGKEALQILEESPFDLVISDVMMPGMGGMELLNSIRELNSDTSVIMITAHPAMELTVSAMKKGAVDFLKKPFKIEDLLYKVDIYLREQTILKSEDHPIGRQPTHLHDKTEELSIKGYIYDSIEDIEGDNEQIFQKIVDLAIKVADGESCSLLLFDEDDNAFHPKIIRSENREAYRQQTLPSLQQIFKEVTEKREALMVHSEVHPEIAPSLICAPLMIRNNVFGILCVRKKIGGEIFTKKDLHYILSLTKAFLIT
jgi:CheY-like chemotaxis protein